MYAGPGVSGARLVSEVLRQKLPLDSGKARKLEVNAADDRLGYKRGRSFSQMEV